MKPTTALKTAAALVAAACLGACGQTGPLYLPKTPAKPAQPAGQTAIPPTTTVTPTPNQ
ncbi:MAG TPA: lipoprotein [Telluria sp.]|nr:lipoprotein [Telluria sp.]